MTARTMLTDQQWELIEPLLPGKDGDRGRTGYDNRGTLEGMLFVARAGLPWRDMPDDFGNWNTVHRRFRRFRRWAVAGVFDRIFEATSGGLDLRAVMVDGSFAKVHQHGTGAPKADAHPRNQRKSRQLAALAVGSIQSSWRWWTRLAGWSSSP